MTTKIIVGLGNPDQQYEGTRHNIGFMFLEWLAKKCDATEFKFDKNLHADIAKGKLSLGKKKIPLIIVRPLLYVNKTGEVVAKIKSKLKAKPENFVLAHDDMDIAFGVVKLSFNKSAGGHRGVGSVIKTLKTEKFWRLRFGTFTAAVKKARAQSAKNRNKFIVDFVLGKFTPKEQKILKKLFAEAYVRLSGN